MALTKWLSGPVVAISSTAKRPLATCAASSASSANTDAAPFDARAAAENADVALAMSQLPFVAFRPGTDKGETEAEPKIWSEQDKFKTTAQQMQDSMARLVAAARSGNLDSIKTAVGDTGKSCKSCHDSYRKE